MPKPQVACVARRESCCVPMAPGVAYFPGPGKGTSSGRAVPSPTSGPSCARVWRCAEPKECAGADGSAYALALGA